MSLPTDEITTQCADTATRETTDESTDDVVINECYEKLFLQSTIDQNKNEQPSSDPGTTTTQNDHNNNNRNDEELQAETTIDECHKALFRMPTDMPAEQPSNDKKRRKN